MYIDPEIAITAALLSMTIYLEYIIMKKAVDIFKCINCKAFTLKISHLVVLNG